MDAFSEDIISYPYIPSTTREAIFTDDSTLSFNTELSLQDKKPKQKIFASIQIQSEHTPIPKSGRWLINPLP